MAETLLEISGLKTYFQTDDGMVRAVDGVDLTIRRGETLSVVGESGCGKTVTAMTVLKLIAMPPGKIVAGRILWKGRDLVPLDPYEMQQIRSREIGIVFQEPMTSLNPVYPSVTRSLRSSAGIRASAGATRWTERSSCSALSTYQRRSNGCATIRTSSRAGCASG